MTTATNDRAYNLRGRADTRVRPDNGILDASALFDKATLAQHGVDNLCARFDLAVVTDQRRIIDFGDGCGIKLPATFLDVNPVDAIGQEIRVSLEIAFGRADVDPVGTRWNVRVKRLFTL